MRLRLLLAASVIFAIGWLAGAHAAAAGRRRPPARAAVVQVTVRPGDSLWALGRSYASRNEDLRRWIYRTERLNGLSGARLSPGERLMLPVASSP